jgi:hypothetical protein
MQRWLKTPERSTCVQQWLSLLGVAALLSSCAMGAGDGGSGYLTGCEIGSDQADTLEGKWTLLPVPIAFHNGDFTSAEMSAMVNAADTWNSFFAASMNSSYIDYGGDPNNPRISDIPEAADATVFQEGTNSIISSGGFSAPIVIYKDLSWPYPSATAAIAFTTFNLNKSVSPIYAMKNAYTEVNYQYFFGSGLPQPDLQSVILHEFGHLAGLYHSCGSPEGPDCSESGLNPEYVSAVMYPTFYFDPTTLIGQVKQQLQPNDQGRANCLYQTTAQ